MMIQQNRRPLLLNALQVQTCLRNHPNTEFTLTKDQLHCVNIEHEASLVVNRLLRNATAKSLSDTHLAVIEEPSGIGKTTFASNFLRHYRSSINPSQEEQKLSQSIYIHIDFNRLRLVDAAIDNQIAWYLKQEIGLQAPAFVLGEILSKFSTTYTVKDLMDLLNSADGSSFLFFLDGIDFVNKQLNTSKNVHPQWNCDKTDKISNRQRVAIVWNLFADYLYGTTSVFFLFAEQYPTLFMQTLNDNAAVPVPVKFIPVALRCFDRNSLLRCLTGTAVTLPTGKARALTVLNGMGLKNDSLFLTYILQYTAGVPGTVHNLINFLLHTKPDLSDSSQFRSIFEAAADSMKPLIDATYPTSDPVLFLKFLGISFLGIPLHINTTIKINGKYAKFIELATLLGFYYVPYGDQSDLISIKIPLFNLLALADYFQSSSLFHAIVESSMVTDISLFEHETCTIRALQKVYFHFIKQAMIDSATRAKALDNQATWGQICGGVFSDCFFSFVEIEIASKGTTRIPSFQYDKPSYITAPLQADPWSHSLEWSHQSLLTITKHFLDANLFAVPHRSTQFLELIFALENDPEKRNRINRNEENEAIVTKFFMFRKLVTAQSGLTFDMVHQDLKLLKKLRTERSKERSSPTIMNRDFHFCYILTGLDYSRELSAAVNLSCPSGALLLASGSYKLLNGRIERRMKEERVPEIFRVPKSVEILLLTTDGAASLFGTETAYIMKSILTRDLKIFFKPEITQAAFDMFNEPTSVQISLSAEALERKRFNAIRRSISQDYSNITLDYLVSNKIVSSQQSPFRNLPYVPPPISILQNSAAVSNIERSSSYSSGLRSPPKKFTPAQKSPIRLRTPRSTLARQLFQTSSSSPKLGTRTPPNL